MIDGPCNYPDCDGGYATGYCHSNCRIILCEACDSEGRILRSNGGPDDIDCGECPVCEGKGTVAVPTEPITKDDFEDCFGGTQA